MSNDEGDEEGLSEQQEGMLERMLRAYASDHYAKAQDYPGGIKTYFQVLIRDVVEDYRDSKAVSRSIYDFSVDRYLFYRRHREMDTQDAIQEAYIDTFEYLVRLKNEYPMLRPPMRDDWRD